MNDEPKLIAYTVKTNIESGYIFAPNIPRFQPPVTFERLCRMIKSYRYGDPSFYTKEQLDEAIEKMKKRYEDYILHEARG